MEVGMSTHMAIGRCCARPRLNVVGGIDERVWPGRLAMALRRMMRPIAGDSDAAERVELGPPETGVGSRSTAPDTNNCCGGPALSDVDACCVADANAKQEGKIGCECPS
jgi:hypothetical protein